MCIDDLVKTADFAESVATSLAILVGGVWSYMLFVKNRQRFPRGAVSHRHTIIDLPDGKKLIHMEVEIKNIGSVLIRLDSAYTWIQQVVPIHAELAKKFEKSIDPVSPDDQEVEWPLLQQREWTYQSGDAELEPSESQVLGCDFVIPLDVEVVRAYTYVRNESKKKRDIGWSNTSTISLRKPETANEER